MPALPPPTAVPESDARAVLPVASLSIHGPVYLGHDAIGQPVTLTIAYRNILLGGEPHAGKSAGLCNLLGHAALCCDADLVLLDGKEVELSLWEPLAQRFVGFDMAGAIDALAELQADMNARYRLLRACGLRKVPPGAGFRMVLLVVDELALFTATYGTTAQQKEFTGILRDLVARGRAAGIMVAAATQRPSADIVPTSLRDLFAYRWALRCPNQDSSDIILGSGWAAQGYTASEIDPAIPGVGWLLAEGGIPRRFRAAYLTDDDIRYLVRAGLALRGGTPSTGVEQAS